MLTFLIRVVEALFAPALLVALLLALAQHAGEASRKKWLLTGGIVGAVAAFVYAMILLTPYVKTREYMNIGMLSATLVVELGFLLFLWIKRKSRAAWRERILGITSALVVVGLALFTLPDIFMHPTTFASYGENFWSLGVLADAVGYLLGLLLVFLAAAALYVAAGRLPLVVAQTVTTAAFLVMMMKQLTGFLQPMVARGFISVPRWGFRLLIRTINAKDYFLFAILAVTVVLGVILFIRSRQLKKETENPAQRRRLLANLRSSRRWSAVMVLCYVLCVFTLTGVRSYVNRAPELTPGEPAQVVGLEIHIPLESIDDGHLHRFDFTASDGTAMRFIVIKKPNSAAYGVGLDACDICGDTGYYERGGDEVVCIRCDVVMNVSTIGFPGGCNPVPLGYTLSEGNMVIQTQDLEAEKGRFR